MFSVNEIFYSIEGEGIRAGYPCVFVRFNGCNLKCDYCDTEYAQCKDAKGKEMTCEDIVKAVQHYGCSRVTLTGGEPMLQKDISTLIRLLASRNIEVNVETNGSLDARGIIGNVPGCIVTMDYKSVTSNMNSHMDLSYLYRLRDTDVLKFVVGNEEDMIDAIRVIKALDIQNVHPHIFFSPVFGSIEPSTIVEFIKTYGLTQCRVQLQLHKFIWPPEQRGV